jgi:hypothetical protein
MSSVTGTAEEIRYTAAVEEKTKYRTRHRA